MKNEIFDEDAGKKVITYNMDIFYKELNKLKKVLVNSCI
jgi:hypothetical protein